MRLLLHHQKQMNMEFNDIEKNISITSISTGVKSESIIVDLIQFKLFKMDMIKKLEENNNMIKNGFCQEDYDKYVHEDLEKFYYIDNSDGMCPS